MSEEKNKLLRSTFLITAIIILSKIVGFLRDAFLAAQFGQGLEKSAYGAAFQLISVFTIFLGTGIGSSFIPMYTQTRLKSGEKSANEYASNVLNLYILVGILISVLGVFLAPALSGLVWSGEPEGRALVTELTALMMPSMVFWAITGVFVNLLNARKHFIPEQLMGFALSFCIIIACMLSMDIQMVAVATSISAIFQVIILLPFLRRRYRYQPRLNVKNKALQRTFKLAIPALISITFDEINTMTDTYFASGMGANVPSAIQESYRLTQPILGVLVVPITTVMFSELSGYAAKGEMDKLKYTVRKSIEILALITIPIIVMAFILQNDIISLFFERGKYTAEAAAFTAPVFAFYIIGVFSFGLRNFLTRVFYSLQRTRLPMIIGISAVGINILLDFLLKDVLGARGLTLATSIAGSVSAITMVIVLRRLLGPMSLRKSISQLLKILLCAAACGLTIYFVYGALPIEALGFWNKLLRVFICCGAGFSVYALLAFLLKIETAGTALNILKRKLSRRKPKN